MKNGSLAFTHEQLYNSLCAVFLKFLYAVLLKCVSFHKYNKINIFNYFLLKLCSFLANKHDTIRKEYWNFIARNLGNLYGPEEAHVHITQ